MKERKSYVPEYKDTMQWFIIIIMIWLLQDNHPYNVQRKHNNNGEIEEGNLDCMPSSLGVSWHRPSTFTCNH